MVWFIWSVGSVMVLNALRLRRRLTGLRRLPASRAYDAEDGYRLLAAEDAAVPEHVRRAAAGHARRHGLDMLDLVPADLPVEHALDLARHLDFRAYRADPFGMGRGAGYALLVEDSALDRSALDLPEPPDPGELGEATCRLGFYTEAVDLAVAPIPARDRTAQRRAWLRSLALATPQTVALPQTLGAAAAGYCLVLAGLAIDLRWGAGLALLYCLLPCLVFAGTPITPRDLGRTVLLRPIGVPLTVWRTLRAPRTRWERRQIARREEARAWYRERIDRGVDRYLGERRADCPWCGSERIGRHVVTRDVLQGKPGRFVLDRCRDCRHIFQNPQITPEGRDFYYRDLYDGLGDVLAERLLCSNTPWYTARAELVAGHAAPRTWLDVGTGKAHFCRVARTVLPETEFDGLDLGDGVEEAVRRGWIGHGHRERFRDVADDLAGRYDVVSMHHYLEHTEDPGAELDAAAKMLEPGGHLLIELPDPESRLGRLLRGFWVPWLAPQHLHMIPIGNLRDALAVRGLKVVAEQRREAHQGPDFSAAAAGVVNRIGLDVERPWWPRPPGRAQYLRAFGGQLVAGPMLAVAALCDLVTFPFMRSRGNAYRVLAVKEAG